MYQTFKFYTRQCESDCNIWSKQSEIANFGASNVRLQTLEQAISDCKLWSKQSEIAMFGRSKKGDDHGGEGKVTTDGQTWKVQVHTIAETKIQTHHKFQIQIQL